jgi:hypothetical protein
MCQPGVTRPRGSLCGGGGGREMGRSGGARSPLRRSTRGNGRSRGARVRRSGRFRIHGSGRCRLSGPAAERLCSEPGELLRTDPVALPKHDPQQGCQSQGLVHVGPELLEARLEVREVGPVRHLPGHDASPVLSEPAGSNPAPPMTPANRSGPPCSLQDASRGSTKDRAVASSPSWDGPRVARVGARPARVLDEGHRR